MDGDLDVFLIDGFELSLGDQFEIVDVGGSRFGSFDGLSEGSSIGNFGLLSLFITYFGDDGNDRLLFAGLDGDFDDDGTVGADDLNLVLFNWNMDGSTVPHDWINQRPLPGTSVGADQLNSVLFNWNKSVPSVATVPEPSSFASLLGLALLFLTIAPRQGNQPSSHSSPSTG